MTGLAQVADISSIMVGLSENEIEALVSQSVMPWKKQLGGAKPLAFTEQGVSSSKLAMSANTMLAKVKV